GVGSRRCCGLPTLAKQRLDDGSPEVASPGYESALRLLTNYHGVAHARILSLWETLGRRPSRAQPEAATPSPTRMAKTSTVSGAVAPWSSATPAPITGIESPTNRAMSRADVSARRFSGAAAASTIPVVPLKRAPAPAPIKVPATRNSARFGVERRTDVTRRARPTNMEIVPSARTRDACSLAVA